ncbi:hypothetical protein D6783_02000 [Candidatus Woesearchaeota archaeon]|nr:MAG: hypothetical protein D6783_02000 [Candidatus Woesearchaeota archaeon]
MAGDIVVELDDDPIHAIFRTLCVDAMKIGDIKGWDLFAKEIPKDIHEDEEIAARIFCLRNMLKLRKYRLEQLPVKEGEFRLEDRKVTFGIDDGLAIVFTIKKKTMDMVKEFVFRNKS